MPPAKSPFQILTRPTRALALLACLVCVSGL